MKRVSVVIPTRNAGSFAIRQINALKRQTVKCIDTIVIDSESTDGSPDIYRAAGFRVLPIPLGEFDHGATRNLGLTQSKSDTIVYLTQDAVLLDDHSLERLCVPFSDPKVGVVCGRQIPRNGAGAIERHARLFNYPTVRARRIWPEARNQGIRAIFNSNSFAAYRRKALQDIGGFPEGLIFGEDQIAAGRALLSGWVLVYAEDALVEHSHYYSLVSEFRRYFDIGVHHVHNRALFESFCSIRAEGRRFVLSELRYLLRYAPHRIPEAGLRTAAKLLAYNLGCREAILPLSIKRQFAMHSAFFVRYGNERR